MTTKHREVDTAAYLLLDDIGERVCVAWTMLTDDQRNDWHFDVQVEQVSYLAFCTLNEALGRVKALRAAGILYDDGTVDPVVMKRLRAKGAVLVGIGDEPVEEDD